MDPVVIAALICSFVALAVALWNPRSGTRRSGKVEVEVWRRRAELRAEEAERARARLRQLGAVARRLRVAVDRLVTMSRQLDDDAMVAETAETLDLVAEFLTASRDERRLEFPAGVAERTGAVRVAVTELLLDLELRHVRRSGQTSEARLRARANALAIAVAELREAVARRVALPGETDPDPDEDEPPLPSPEADRIACLGGEGTTTRFAHRR